MSISIDQLEHKLKAVLTEEQFSSTQFEGKSAQDLLIELGVYHQELEYQNEELRRVQLALEESKQFYTDLFDHAPINYLIYDHDLLIKRANSECRDTLNVDLEGHSFSQFIHPDSQDTFYLHIKAVEQSAQGKSSSLDLITANQKRLRVKIQSNLVYLYDKPMIRSAFIDLSKEYEQQRKIEFLTYRDQLTGLYNRTYFEQVLDEYALKDIFPLGLIIGDMNALKLANDTFGHELGDALLVALANVLEQNCPSDGLLFRLGGDEFLFLLPHTNEQKLLAIIRQIEQQCSRTKIGLVELSASFGHAIQSSKEISLSSLMRQAEDLMYQRKLFASKSVRQSLVSTLIESLFTQNEEQHQHALQAKKIAMKIASCLGLSSKQNEELFLAAYVHDLGKLLASVEKGLDTHHRRHPEKGYRVLCSLDDQHAVAEAVLHHHERWDGSGYPMGLKGEDIPFLARVLTLVDIICWYMANHPQNPKKGLDGYLLSLSSLSLDPQLVETLLASECI